MAAASRRRRTHSVAGTGSASTKRVPQSLKSTKTPKNLQSLQSLQHRHRLHPDDPRLKLSMRAFHPALDKTKARRPRFSFSSSQSSQSSQSPTIAPSTTYLAFPPSTVTYTELYDPSSPWGVKGIKYDPCSPWASNSVVPLQFAVAESSNSDSASPHSSPSPPPPPPPPGRQELQFYLASSTDLQETKDATNHGLASDIADMFATRRQVAETREKEAKDKGKDREKDKEKNKEKKKPNYPNLRFVLADTNTAAPESAATARSLLSKAFMGAPMPRPAKATPKKAQPAKKTPVPAPATACRCPPQVPSVVQMAIDNNTGNPGKTKSNVTMLKQQFREALLLLCSGHREKYQRMEATSAAGFSVFSVRPSASAPASHYTPTPPRPPPALLKPAAFTWAPTTAPTMPPAARPFPKQARDGFYRHDMLREIASRFSAIESEDDYTHGDVANRVVYDLLTVAVHPQPVVHGQGDAYFLSGEEAYELLDRCSPMEPVVTQSEQMFRWRPRTRPIKELFRRMENLDRKVSVQVPSRRCTDDSFESRDLAEVRRRFLQQQSKANNDPWNILDLRSPLPAAVLPQFLTSENCQLLPRLRDEVLNPSRAERDSASREQWNEWRDVLEWVLLSEGGHNTSPHTDSHGLATWITVQEGLFGFGWMSHPTPSERQQWMDDPQGFRGGRWCFMILEPGQTVFFNSGTVHFVFRQHGQATLALGGHILQWSGIGRWLEIVGAQMKNPHITNEDMEWSAPKYVRVVARLVAMRLQQEISDGGLDDEASRIEAMGGEAAVKHLLAQLKDFDDEYLRPRPKGKNKKKRR